MFMHDYPYLGFFRAFSSVVRQMPGYNIQRRGTAHTLPSCCFVLCIFCFVLCIFCVVLCIFVFYVFLCCSMYFCVVLCIFVLFYVLFVL
jgi:hypothetical protein